MAPGEQVAFGAALAESLVGEPVDQREAPNAGIGAALTAVLKIIATTRRARWRPARSGRLFRTAVITSSRLSGAKGTEPQF